MFVTAADTGRLGSALRRGKLVFGSFKLTGISIDQAAVFFLISFGGLGNGTILLVIVTSVLGVF